MTQASPFSLAGLVALVAGANTGLGRGTAIALAQAGADIVGIARSSTVDTERGVAAAGRVDILINHAGIIRRNDALAFTEQDWDAALNVNLKTPFFLAQAVAQAMVKAGRGGKIINIVSMLSFQGGIRTASYTASKSGLAGVTKLLANEWAAYGINVNAIAPGYFETNNTTALRADEQRNRDILGRIPRADGASRQTWAAPRYSWRRRPRTMSMGRSCPSMVGGCPDRQWVAVQTASPNSLVPPRPVGISPPVRSVSRPRDGEPLLDGCPDNPLS